MVKGTSGPHGNTVDDTAQLSHPGARKLESAGHPWPPLVGCFSRHSLLGLSGLLCVLAKHIPQAEKGLQQSGREAGVHLEGGGFAWEEC